MKKLFFLPLLLLSVLTMAACTDLETEATPDRPETPEQPGGKDDGPAPDATAAKVRIVISASSITATMEDHAAGRDFLSRLPLEVTLKDYADPSPALTTAGAARGCAPVPGDIAIYAPWGNVAIFCRRSSYSDDLVRIGRIDGDGIEALRVAGNIRVKFVRE